MEQTRQETAAFLAAEGIQLFSSNPFDAEGFRRFGAFAVKSLTTTLVDIIAIVGGTLVELGGLMAGVLPQSVGGIRFCEGSGTEEQFY